MLAPDTFPTDGQLNLIPLSMRFRFLQSTIKNLEWIGNPGEESCLACGSGSRLGHLTGCPVENAIEKGYGLDAMDGAIGEGMFLAAYQRKALLDLFRGIARRLNRIRSRVTRIEELLPRT